MILPSHAPEALPDAIDILLDGGLVALPTETVYGLAGLSTSARAIARIYDAKRRPRTNPLISHVADLDMADRYAVVDPVSRRLAQALWPGPLTLILPLRPGGIDRSSTNGRDLVAIRAPAGFAHELITRLDQPLAAPSANTSGRISPTTAQHVVRDLGDRVDLIIDGGPTALGVESTVVRVTPDGVAILRPGALTAEALADLAGVAVIGGAEQDAALSPGTLLSHYAPRARVRLDVARIHPGEAVLTFAARPLEGVEQAAAVFDLSPDGDLAEAARNLFELLHRADATGAPSIAVAPIPQQGLGVAVNDRLRRAAAPRGSDGSE